MPSGIVKTLRLACAAIAAVTAAGQAVAAYPDRPIHIVVPFTAGSGSDSSSRFYGRALGGLLGQSVIVDNKPGANGIIGLQYVKQQPADGYTVLLASNSPMTVNPVVFKNLPYDPASDFRPISGLDRSMNVWVVPMASPLKSVGDIVGAQQKTGQPLSVGTYSAGYQLASAWFARLAGIGFNDISYKGQAQIMSDIIGSQLDMAVVDLSGALPLIQQHKMRALAVSGEQRHRDLPDVPTLRESGYPDYVQYSWVSFYVRTQTPDDVVARLTEAMRQVLAMPETKIYMDPRGGELMPYAPEQMNELQKTESARFRKIAEQAGIQPQ